MNKQNTINLLYVICFFVLSYFYYTSFAEADISLLSRVRGKILLQVEKNGEAWYVDPLFDERYYLGRPNDAFKIMKELGEGITNKDLSKIPVAITKYQGLDSDNDGLSDAIENSLKTDKYKADSDGDGYDDKTEILNNYNPSGSNKITIDINFTKKQLGKILLQVENNGEAWYVNPADQKRFFLGNPANAFYIMKNLGVGITNNNLAQIPEHYLDLKTNNDYIVNNNTTPVPNNDDKIKYLDPKYPFSFEYLKKYSIKKSSDFDYVIFLGDYDQNLFKEKKSFITIMYQKIEPSIVLEAYKTSSKTGAKKIYDKYSIINSKEAYSEEYQFIENNSYEITTTIKNNTNEFLQIQMAASTDSKSLYDKIYSDVINSVKFK
ncbi:MAG: hypothetical protein UT48_C0037G0007 [Parcubacteria group bacterium GW2011_GWE2_39_37]|uniref:Thrombospondin type 3 repeat superfamily protein n=1 Tax=Candidatus Falkowbacteria bacterium GW2011_GWF2_39_8 TaxID=1618642 RepID=A0A0G0PYA0_9BACT|nr:MAG: hypothetical protein UT48_C0037G0007 [Parcubacteria group bacterium GW2011_GWE2_39_37]KKR32873.1 MAG: hypothetical protein UT64_C0020G0008 [Candidatus Falkowbacteria bacterium GW2011_GWF2_39_8]